MARRKILAPRPPRLGTREKSAGRESGCVTSEIAAALHDELHGLAQDILPSGGRFDLKGFVAPEVFPTIPALRPSPVQ